MVLYRCLCGYEAKLKADMKKHLNRKISCMPDQDMELINIEDLLVEGRIYENLSHFSRRKRR